MGKSPYSRPVVWIVLAIVAYLFLIQAVAPTKQASINLNYGQFIDQVEQGNISSININSPGGETAETTGEFVNPIENKRTFVVTIPSSSIGPTAEKVKEKNKTSIVTITTPSPFIGLFWILVPFAIIVGFIIIMRKKGGGGFGGFTGGFTRSRARLALQDDKDKKTFEDVAGVDEAKEELQEIIEFLKEPGRFVKLGGRIPKGVLLLGSPGTGKTLLAKAVAGEAGVPFLSISGSEFVELFVGVGASRVRSLFEEGKKKAPCIIFIDEIDAVGRSRGPSLNLGHEEREQTLNQLLTEMDGFDTDKGVIIIGASNRPDVLDPALLRPGRFDRRVIVNKPDLRGRLGILKVHTKKIVLAESVDLGVVARGTVGFTGADLANLANEAALLAGRENAEQVSMKHLELAKDRVMMGPERKSMLISPEEKRTTAYHEAGHAVVALFVPESDPIHKVTIIPRGLSLGSTHQLPTDDKHNLSKIHIESRIAVLMAGRVAEEIFLHQSTTGASNDIDTATELAYRMVCEWGMSDLGPIKLGSQNGHLFFGGQSLERSSSCSDDTTREIDLTVKEIISRGISAAKNILTANKSLVEKIVSGLIEKETLDIEDITRLRESI
ncbi:MAG: ATP-dependent zinc metalloprotease FtsH [Patescibacteria group bacterium]